MNEQTVVLPAYLQECLDAIPSPGTSQRQPAPVPTNGNGDYDRARKYVAAVPEATEGERNTCLNGLAYRLLERFNLDEGQHRELCLSWALSCTPPILESEARATVRSAWNGCQRKGTAGTKRTEPRGRPVSRPDLTQEAPVSVLGDDGCWPAPLDEAALHGLAGQVVRAIDPHTEADPVAVLVQFLVAFGNAIGRTAYFTVGATRHFGNLFAVLVGKSGRGRKGTAWDEAHRLFSEMAEWVEKCVTGGLSSAEGLIYHVRDPIYVTKQGKQEVLDPGVTDKRLLCMESEFTQVLKQGERNGNTLSPVLRQAWERGSLRTLTRNSPLTATGAHISIIGHVTRQDLTRYLTSTECANGFGNRFLWVAVKRSKLLPDGGSVPDVEVAALRRELSKAVEFAKAVMPPICRDDEATKLWHEVYQELTAERDGLAAAVCGRGEAQVMRLAMLYALLDHSTTIRVEHLRGALAVWRYCEDSADFIFGDSLGDDTADEIAEALQRERQGMTRNEIRDLFGRHRSAAEIARALGVLARNGRAHPTYEATRGRPVERWFWGKEAAR
ncbi:MAG: primase alpha helix C-terminal domain-containing protein [Planctomycetota bacterium]